MVATTVPILAAPKRREPETPRLLVGLGVVTILIYILNGLLIVRLVWQFFAQAAQAAPTSDLAVVDHDFDENRYSASDAFHSGGRRSGPILQTAVAQARLATPTPIVTVTPAATSTPWVDPDLGESPVVLEFNGWKQACRLSCEANNAAALIQYFGLRRETTGPDLEREIQAALPKSDDPEKGYVGDCNIPPSQYGRDGYGIHAAGLAPVFENYGLAVELWPADRQATERTTALKEQIQQGHPVIIWGLVNWGEDDRGVFSLANIIWGSDDGTRGITGLAGEHTYIVYGFQESPTAETSWLVFNSANGQKETVVESRLSRSWWAFGHQAIVGLGPK